MAVFMINSCVYNRCGRIFPALYELIEHIEDVHIDLDPAVVEQKEASQPAMIPMSYALKFSWTTCVHNMPPAPETRRRLLSLPRTPSVRSTTPTGSEMDEDEAMSASEDSNDSWTTVEEYSSDFILRYGVKMNPSAVSGALGPAAQEKPFACPVPGCKKRYKNVNGIKYHSKNGHKKDGKVRKAYKCQCGKNYKTAQGLKSHSTIHLTSGGAGVGATRANMPGLVVTSSPARPIAGQNDTLLRIVDKKQQNVSIIIPGQVDKVTLPRVDKATLPRVEKVTPPRPEKITPLRAEKLTPPRVDKVTLPKFDKVTLPRVTVHAQPPAFEH